MDTDFCQMLFLLLLRLCFSFLVNVVNYISNVKHLASYDYSRIGAEGEDSHSENGINRSYDDRAKCFYGVLPFAKMF